MMKVFALIFAISSLSTAAWAAPQKDFKGFVQVRPGVSLYTEYTVNNPKMPTLVLVNGLTYHTKFWMIFAAHLKPYGYNILRFDPQGMGQTLLRDGVPRKPFSIEQQARDFHFLTLKMGLQGPLNILGLSYGGGLSMAFAKQFPQRVRTMILVAPYTEPVTNADQSIKSQIKATRLMQPWNPATDEELYSYFLRQQVYTINPILEPATLEFPTKPEGIFQLVEGIRKYDFFEAAKSFPPRSTHLVIASNDQYIPIPMLNKFWSAIPPRARGSKVLVQFSEHKIPESQPSFLAYWTDMILKGEKNLINGGSFEANPFTNQIRPAK